MNALQLLEEHGITVKTFSQIKDVCDIGKSRLMVGIYAITNGYYPIKIKIDNKEVTYYISK